MGVTYFLSACFVGWEGCYYHSLCKEANTCFPPQMKNYLFNTKILFSIKELTRIWSRKFWFMFLRTDEWVIVVERPWGRCRTCFYFTGWLPVGRFDHFHGCTSKAMTQWGRGAECVCNIRPKNVRGWPDLLLCMFPCSCVRELSARISIFMRISRQPLPGNPSIVSTNTWSENSPKRSPCEKFDVWTSVWSDVCCLPSDVAR